MITILLIFFPLVAAMLLLLLKGELVKKAALAAAVVELAISIYAVAEFQRNADMQFEVSYNWIRSMGIMFHVGIDGISMLLVLLTTALVPLIILTSFRTSYK